MRPYNLSKRSIMKDSARLLSCGIILVAILGLFGAVPLFIAQLHNGSAGEVFSVVLVVVWSIAILHTEISSSGLSANTLMKARISMCTATGLFYAFSGGDLFGAVIYGVAGLGSLAVYNVCPVDFYERPQTVTSEVIEWARRARRSLRVFPKWMTATARPHLRSLKHCLLVGLSVVAPDVARVLWDNERH